MKPESFDALTKWLATRESRRRALQQIGGSLGGGALAGLVPADQTDKCAIFCAEVFGVSLATVTCTAQAALHTGLCYSCGPASPGGGVAPAAICCTRNAHGFCTSTKSATCCGSGQTCQSGTCVSPTTTTTRAPGQTTTTTMGPPTTPRSPQISLW